MILEEAEKLYNQLTTELTNGVMAAAAAIRASSIPSPSANNNKQKLAYKNDNTYQTEEFRYNNIKHKFMTMTKCNRMNRIVFSSGGS